jgi:hypothetical protein
VEIVFFLAHPSDARSVTSSHDLPGDPAAEPIAALGPRALLDLAVALSPDGATGFVPLRDETCRSYPVWAVSDPLRVRIESLDDEAIDALASAWQPHADTDAWERATCLAALRDALRERDADETLFALLEERAL